MSTSLNGKSASPAIGDVILGRFVLERELGRGGMGVVFAARHTTLTEKVVAVKFLLERAPVDPTIRERFIREAKALSGIANEHVLNVLDVGQLDDGPPFLVTEYLEGLDLSDLLQKNGPLDPKTAVDFILQACVGLAAVHAKGVIHRDLKPSNLFLTKGLQDKPLIKILDFGLAKTVGPDVPDAPVTTTHVVMGSIPYMSPEQCKSLKLADRRSDIWALGAILFRLLTNRYPFEGAVTEMLTAIVTFPPTDITTLRSDLDEGIVAVVRWCLQKDPDLRPQSVAALATALAPFASTDASQLVGLIEKLTEQRRSQLGGDGLGFAETAPLHPEVRRRGGRGRFVAIIVSAAVLLSVAIAMVVFAGRSVRGTELAPPSSVAPPDHAPSSPPTPPSSSTPQAPSRLPPPQVAPSSSRVTPPHDSPPIMKSIRSVPPTPSVSALPATSTRAPGAKGF